MKVRSACILFFFMVLGVRFLGQEIPFEDKNTPSVLNDYELTDKEYAAWKLIRNNWFVSEYEKIQAENKIKLNCKDCESFFVEVILKIDANGKLEYYKLVNGKKCGIALSKQLEIRMMRTFFKFDFPPELRNTIFKTRLGNVLKC